MTAPWQSTRILFRIVLPFTFLFTLVTILSWISSVLLGGHFFDAGLRQQLVRVAQGVSQSPFLLNPLILKQVKGIVDAEIVLSDGDGQVLSSTIAPEDALAQEIFTVISKNIGHYKDDVGYEVAIESRVYRGVFLKISSVDLKHAYLSLWQSTAGAGEFKKSIVMVTAIISLVGIIALAAAGYAIARSISTPVVQLARISEQVASGDFCCRVEIQGQDEIAQLGQAFNNMIDRLHESERKLVEAGKLAAAGQLAAGVAHEIKNPLTAIKMFVQVLQGRMTTDSKNLETLGIVLSEINRLDRIVEQIVQRARPEDGVRLELTQPVDLLDEVLLVSRDSLREAHITVRTDIADDIPMVALDREKIKQVLWNIIVNAKDAMLRGGELLVRVRHAVGQGTVELIFEDTGVGLLAGVEPEACFSSFFTTKPEGLGLGLSMSREIVARHGGTLTLTSRNGGGVCVTITLSSVLGEDRL